MVFVFFFVLWIIWNGKITAEIAVLGFLICAALYFFSWKYMGYGLKFEKAVAGCAVKAFRYLLFLLIEIIKANLETAKMILAFDMEPEPVLVKFHAGLRTEAGQVILANSITLTPGTLTIDIQEGEYLVHSLDRSFAKGLDQSGFAEKIGRMETIIKREEEKYGP